MPLTLVATPGAANANAYATVAEAEAYAAYRVGGAAFIALTSDQKIQALVTATRAIDTLEIDPGFLGDRETDTQALAWPRDDGDLPAELVNATIELAMSYVPLFATGATADPLNPAASAGNIKVVDVPGAKVEFFGSTTVTATALERFPHSVQQLLLSLVVVEEPLGYGTSEVVRGS